MTQSVSCPYCGEDFEIFVTAPEGQRCGAEMPDAGPVDQRTVCEMWPHSDDDHDPEHTGRNASGSLTKWRSSEYGPAPR